ncbi:Piwi-like protein 1 [Bienertia sinuspersici]
MKKTKNPDDSFMDEIKEKSGLEKKDVLTTSKLGVIVENLKDGGDDFKRFFVLYVLSVFLTPTANGHVDLYLSKAVADVNKIIDMDWCSFILRILCDGIAKCQKNNSKRVMGCVLALEILYFHRFMFRGEKAPTKLPLIQHWTDEVVSERLIVEKKAGFGICSIDQKTYPVSKKKEKDKKKEVPYDTSSGGCSRNEDSISSCVGRILQIQLPDHLSTNDEIKLKAKDRPKELKKNVEVQVENKDVSDSPEMSQMGKILSDPANLRYIDSLVEKFLSMKKLSDDMPSFELLSPEDEQGEKNDAFDKVIKDVAVEIQQTYDGHDFENGDDLLSLFSAFNCGLTDDSIEFISWNMSKSKDVMKNLPHLQQEVVDYCLLRVTKEDSKDEDFKKLKLQHLYDETNAATFLGYAKMVAMRRRVYRTAICAAIILSDRNEARQDILVKLKAFNEKKSDIQLILLEMKKKRKQEEKEKKEEVDKEKKKQKI